jgi:hypothetical protein
MNARPGHFFLRTGADSLAMSLQTNPGRPRSKCINVDNSCNPKTVQTTGINEMMRNLVIYPANERKLHPHLIMDAIETLQKWLIFGACSTWTTY